LDLKDKKEGEPQFLGKSKKQVQHNQQRKAIPKNMSLHCISSSSSCKGNYGIAYFSGSPSGNRLPDFLGIAIPIDGFRISGFSGNDQSFISHRHQVIPVYQGPIDWTFTFAHAGKLFLFWCTSGILA